MQCLCHQNNNQETTGRLREQRVEIFEDRQGIRKSERAKTKENLNVQQMKQLSRASEGGKEQMV